MVWKSLIDIHAACYGAGLTEHQFQTLQIGKHDMRKSKLQYTVDIILPQQLEQKQQSVLLLISAFCCKDRIALDHCQRIQISHLGLKH